MPKPAQKLVAAARANVPEGTYAVGAGIMLAAITAYGFQIIAARKLTGTGYAALNGGLWAIVFIVAPGLFQPLEQEVARAIAHRRAQGIGGAPLVRRAAVLGAALAAAVIVLALAFNRPLIDHLFHGYGGLFAPLLVALASYFCAHTTRGVLSGNGRFGAYGLMQGAEGVIRIAFCVVLLVIGTKSPGLYGFALAVPPILAVLISLRGQHGLLSPGPEAPYSELSSALSLLLVGSLLAQLLSYASVLTVSLLAKANEKALAGKFITGMFIARVPILAAQAVQAALLPKLAHLSGEGRHQDFRSGMRRLLVVVVGLALAGALVAATVGPTIGKILFKDKWILGHRDLAMLTAGSGAFILALTLAQGLIALKGYSRTALSWIAGIAVFGVVMALGNDLFFRAENAFLAGSLAAALAMGVFLVNRMRSADATLEELVEIVEHEPLEL